MTICYFLSFALLFLFSFTEQIVLSTNNTEKFEECFLFEWLKLISTVFIWLSLFRTDIYLSPTPSWKKLMYWFASISWCVVYNCCIRYIAFSTSKLCTSFTFLILGNNSVRHVDAIHLCLSICHCDTQSYLVTALYCQARRERGMKILRTLFHHCLSFMFM